ncbi:MAG: polymer-forming cytoskeletal protein [bacterium]|nr:polymer-forming cytoskeletal protein [bacterium]
MSAPNNGGGGGVGALTAFIDQGSEFSGKLSFKDTVRIDGRFEGEITSENTLIVGETGHVQANITSETVIISGEVQGDIIASGQVSIHKTGCVLGDIQTASLLVEEGAQVNGRIDMSAPGMSDRSRSQNKNEKNEKNEKSEQTKKTDEKPEHDSASSGSSSS